MSGPLVCLAESPKCSHCKRFSKHWNAVIGALGKEYEKYFDKPPASEWPTYIEAVPSLSILDSEGHRMEELEDELLRAWRENNKTVNQKIAQIAKVMSKHLSFDNPNHDDLMDMATHVKLSDALTQPSNNTIKAPTQSRKRSTVPGAESKRREPVPQTPPISETRPKRKDKTPQQKHSAYFFNPDSHYETAYVVGTEINYYGCDQLSCVNV